MSMNQNDVSIFSNERCSHKEVAGECGEVRLVVKVTFPLNKSMILKVTWET